MRWTQVAFSSVLLFSLFAATGSSPTLSAFKNECYVGQNLSQSPNDAKSANTENERVFQWKPVFYRTVQIASWIFAVLVTLGLAEMVREYLGPGQGAASPFGKLTGQAVLFNIFVWGLPTAAWLCVIHFRRIKSLFIEQN